MTKDFLIQEITESGESVLPKETLKTFTYDHLVSIYNRTESEKKMKSKGCKSCGDKTEHLDNHFLCPYCVDRGTRI